MVDKTIWGLGQFCTAMSPLKDLRRPSQQFDQLEKAYQKVVVNTQI